MSRKSNGVKHMGLVTKTSTVENAYGQKLDAPVKFEYSYEELSAYSEIPEKELPDEDEILTVVNAKRNASARAAAQTKALAAAGVSKPTLEDPKVQFNTMVKVLMASGQDEPTARAFANEALNTNF